MSTVHSMWPAEATDPLRPFDALLARAEDDEDDDRDEDDDDDEDEDEDDDENEDGDDGYSE